MIDLFVSLYPGYTHEQAETMPHLKLRHYLRLRMDRDAGNAT